MSKVLFSLLATFMLANTAFSAENYPLILKETVQATFIGTYISDVTDGQYLEFKVKSQENLMLDSADLKKDVKKYKLKKGQKYSVSYSKRCFEKLSHGACETESYTEVHSIK